MKILNLRRKLIQQAFLGMLSICVLMVSAPPVWAQLVTITSPISGDNWPKRSTKSITWTPSTSILGEARISIQLMQGTTPIGNIAENIPVTLGSYSWVVGNYRGGTANPGPNYIIRIQRSDVSSPNFDSGAFTISPPIRTPPPETFKNHLKLCQLVNCTTETPTIRSVSGNCTPGGLLSIDGRDLGMEVGIVTMTGPTFGPVNLRRVAWISGLAIYGDVPEDLTGVVDQIVQIQVETSDHRVSNRFPILFKAAREMQLVPSSQVRVIRCADPALCSDKCHAFPEYTFSAEHVTLCCFSGDSGVDAFAAGPFLNGWVIDNWYCLLGNPNTHTDAININLGSNRFNITVPWNSALLEFDRDGTYACDVVIKGPRGTSPW